MATALREFRRAGREQPCSGRGARPSVPYSSKIIKAGALISDTKTLLAHWDTTASVAENINRVQRENLLGKVSRSRVGDILVILRQRYLSEEPVTRALVTLVHGKFPAPALERLLYFHSARADRLLRDAVTDILMPMQARGLRDINVQNFQRSLARQAMEETAAGRWSDSTLTRISRGLLSTLRDFGILQGAVNKRIAPAFLPVTAFSYILFYLRQHQPSGAKLIELPDWKLFFLSQDGVERLLFEAHQRELLEYQCPSYEPRLPMRVRI